MSRTLKIAIPAVLAVVVIGLLALNVWIGTVVKAAIENVGPQLTKTSFKVEDVTIRMLLGYVEIKGLEIGNPAGYKKPTAIKLGLVRVRMNVFSVLWGTMTVQEILIEAPEITVEGSLTKNNLTTIRDNVLGAPVAGAEKPAAEKPDNRPPVVLKKKILIQDFALRGAKMDAHLTTVLGESTVALGLPDIHLKDIGKETGGATADHVISAVFSAVIRSVGSAIGESAKGIFK